MLRTRTRAHPSRPRAGVTNQLKLPTGRLAPKSTVVAEFNKVQRGDRLSLDKSMSLRRFAVHRKTAPPVASTCCADSASTTNSADSSASTAFATGATSAANSNPSTNLNNASGNTPAACNSEKRFLSLGDDFAMAFHDYVGVGENRTVVWQWWIGRVVILQRKKVVLRNPVSLEEPDPDVLVEAVWYQALDASRCSYKLDGLVNSQARRGSLWSLELYLGSPLLLHTEGNRYKLENADEVVKLLDENLQAVEEQHPIAARNAAEVKDQLPRQKITQAPDFDSFAPTSSAEATELRAQRLAERALRKDGAAGEGGAKPQQTSGAAAGVSQPTAVKGADDARASAMDADIAVAAQPAVVEAGAAMTKADTDHRHPKPARSGKVPALPVNLDSD
eukprot:1831169-Prymnesium_polylepis.1